MGSVSHIAAEQAKDRESQRPREKHKPLLAKPLTEDQAKGNTGIQYDICARTQALALLAFGLPTRAVQDTTGIPQRTLRNILEKAKKRGFEPEKDQRILLHYVEDGVRTGRPLEIKEEIKKKVVDSIQSDRNNREKSSEVIAYEHGISSTSALRVLHEYGFNPVKKTTKPGLNKAQRAARLEWCTAHKDWTLEDWKNVIWTDETSVCLGQKRGYTRVWRKGDEVFDKTVIRQRWSGYSEFMFWGCFTYDELGPCHIFTTETAKMKKAALEHIKLLDAELEQEAKTEWELDLVTQGPRPRRRQKWSWTDKKGKLKRGGKGGVDWYKYWFQVCKPHLIPFAEKCKQRRSSTIIQQDGAGSHSHHWIQRQFRKASLTILKWPGNSPDLNPIEKAWGTMKRRTTYRGAPTQRAGMTKSWFANWPAMDLASVQAWIEALPHNIAEIIRLEGGNEYKEGRESKRAYRGRRKVGQLFHHSWLGVESGDCEQVAEDNDWSDQDSETSETGEAAEEFESLQEEATAAESPPEIPHTARNQAAEPSQRRVTRSQTAGRDQGQNTKARERQRG
jgi:hypothetical protein